MSGNACQKEDVAKEQAVAYCMSGNASQKVDVSEERAKGNKQWNVPEKEQAIAYCVSFNACCKKLEGSRLAYIYSKVIYLIFK